MWRCRWLSGSVLAGIAALFGSGCGRVAPPPVQQPQAAPSPAAATQQDRADQLLIDVDARDVEVGIVGAGAGDASGSDAVGEPPVLTPNEATVRPLDDTSPTGALTSDSELATDAAPRLSVAPQAGATLLGSIGRAVVRGAVRGIAEGPPRVLPPAEDDPFPHGEPPQ